MELLDPSSDKADAIKAFCRAEGISMENTVAFGDGSNDIGMLKTVARGYCMENEEIETKRAAYKVVADNDHDGIAEGIHDCFEIDRQKEAPELKDLEEALKELGSGITVDYCNDKTDSTGIIIKDNPVSTTDLDDISRDDGLECEEDDIDIEE